MAEPRNDGTIVWIDGTAAVVVDERPRPIVVTTWFGQATERLVDDYFDWFGARLVRARAARERLVLVIENALIRGAVTALGWVMPSLATTQIVGSIDEAIDRALTIIERERLRTPAGFSRATYRRPTRP